MEKEAKKQVIPSIWFKFIQFGLPTAMVNSQIIPSNKSRHHRKIKVRISNPKAVKNVHFFCIIRWLSFFLKKKYMILANHICKWITYTLMDIPRK